MASNPKIVFEASILTDKAFWAKALGGVALVATALGFHPEWLSAANQAEIAGGVAMLAALGFQLWGGQGPVSLTGPISTPDPTPLSPGTHTVTVAAPPAPVPPPTAAVTVTRAPTVLPTSIINPPMPLGAAVPPPPAQGPAA
jgi:hypothetical protein